MCYEGNFGVKEKKNTKIQKSNVKCGIVNMRTVNIQIYAIE